MSSDEYEIAVEKTLVMEEKNTYKNIDSDPLTRRDRGFNLIKSAVAGSQDPRQVNIKCTLEYVVPELLEMYYPGSDTYRYALDIKSLHLSSEKAVTLALIINELMFWGVKNGDYCEIDRFRVLLSQSLDGCVRYAINVEYKPDEDVDFESLKKSEAFSTIQKWVRHILKGECNIDTSSGILSFIKFDEAAYAA